MSYAFANKCVANEWRKLWQFARFTIADASTARFNALCSTPSATWCRCFRPVRGSIEIREEGKTYCHAHWRAAFGDFRARANGRWTLPNPSSRSWSCCALTRTKCRRNGSLRFSGSMVTRSFPPFASRTVICASAKSMSLTRSRTHSHQAQAATIQQTGHQFGHAVEVSENLLYLAARQNHWELRRFFRALDLFQPADLIPEHLFVEKKQMRSTLGSGSTLRR